MLRTKWLALYLVAAFAVYVLAISLTIKHKLLSIADMRGEDFYPMNEYDINAQLVAEKQKSIWRDY